MTVEAAYYYFGRHGMDATVSAAGLRTVDSTVRRIMATDEVTGWAIKGAVVTAGKETFCAGADLTMLEVFSRTFTDMAKAQGEEMAVKHLFEESRKLSQLYLIEGLR